MIRIESSIEQLRRNFEDFIDAVEELDFEEHWKKNQTAWQNQRERAYQNVVDIVNELNEQVKNIGIKIKGANDE